MEKNLARILNEVDERKDELLKFAARLISFKTPNPPAKNTLPAQKWIASEMKRIGMEVEMVDVYPGETDAVGTLRGKRGGKTIAFNGHIDVAEVKKDEKWDFDPFRGTYDERYLYGRGSTDMKGGFASAFFAVKLFLEKAAPKHGLMIQSVIGEEAGEPGTKRLLEKGYRCDFAIIPEPNSLEVQEQGGVITFWIKIKSPKTYHDAVRHKMIHAGGGVYAANTIEKMCKIMEGMQELERHWAVMKRYPRMTPGANTINPSVIEGGRNPIFIPDECRIWYTAHLLPNEDVDDVKREITKHVMNIAKSDVWLRNNPPEITWGGESLVRERGEVFPSSHVDEKNPYVKMLLETREKVLRKRSETSVWPSVSDAGWFHKFGIPSVICGPGRIEDAHMINEKITVDELLSAAKLYLAYLLRLNGEISP
ncbi:MAG: acetylornithine deacetylase [Candidatus Hadarchaeales archaeon]